MPHRLLTLPLAVKPKEMSAGLTVTDIEKDKQVIQAIGSEATDAEVARLMRLSTRDIGSFVAEVGFQRETRKNFRFPGGALVITAAVSYPHASRSARSYTPTLRVEISVNERRKGARPIASAAAETNYSQFTKFVSTQAWLTVKGRLYDVMVSCDHNEKR